MRLFLILTLGLLTCETVLAREYVVNADARSGGANARTWTAQCPPGFVMKGVRLVVGGTCHRQCDPDGRPVSTFQIICWAR